jgi:hypothetical protein
MLRLFLQQSRLHKWTDRAAPLEKSNQKQIVIRNEVTRRVIGPWRSLLVCAMHNNHVVSIGAAVLRIILPANALVGK